MNSSKHADRALSIACTPSKTRLERPSQVITLPGCGSQVPGPSKKCAPWEALLTTNYAAGMIKVRDGTGTSIYLEVFKVPAENVGRLLQQIPPPLGLGTVDLEGGESVKGFICEGYVASQDSGFEVEEITKLQSWLEYLKLKT